MNATQIVPQRLIDDIRRGKCVAFVGAGFSAAAGIRPWNDLLLAIAEDAALDAATRNYVKVRIASGRSDHFEEAAQLLKDRLKDRFIEGLARELISKAEKPEIPAERQMRKKSAMDDRIDWLRGIPFSSVLTTNFDGILEGEVASRELLGSLLKRFDRGTWESPTQHWTDREKWRAVKLHGDLSDPQSVIISRLDYRKKLHQETFYLHFLRSLFLHNTVLFLGFSFTDSYINELRSEILSLLGESSDRGPLAYAVVHDAAPQTVEYFREHERVELINYSTGDQKTNHTEFDTILETIYRETNPELRFGKLLAGKKILWVDKHPDNNEMEQSLFLSASARASSDPPEFVLVDTVDDALRHLQMGGVHGEDSDLIISRYDEENRTAVQLLTEMRHRDISVPLIVYGWHKNEQLRRREVVRLGAYAYCYEAADLREKVESILEATRAPESGHIRSTTAPLDSVSLIAQGNRR